MHDIEIFEQVICHDNSFNSIINVNYNLMHTIIKPTQEFSPFPPLSTAQVALSREKKM